MKKLATIIFILLSFNSIASIIQIHEKALNTYKKGSIKEAIKIYENEGIKNIIKAAESENISDKKLAGILNDYAYFLIKEENYKIAKDILDEVINLDNQRSVAYYNFAEIYDKEKINHKARENILIYSFLRGADKFIEKKSDSYDFSIREKTPKLVKKYLEIEELLDIKEKNFSDYSLKNNNDIDFIVFLLNKNKEEISFYDKNLDTVNLWGFLFYMESNELLEELSINGFDFTQKVEGESIIEYGENYYQSSTFNDYIYKLYNYKPIEFSTIKNKLLKLYNKLSGGENINDINEKNVDEILDRIYEYKNEDLANFYYDYALYLIGKKEVEGAIEELEKGEKLNIKNQSYYLKTAKIYTENNYKIKANRSLKKYLTLHFGDSNMNYREAEESIPEFVIKNLTKKEIQMFTGAVYIGYGYYYTDEDAEALKLIIDYNLDKKIDFSYKEGGVSVYEGIKLLKNKELMKHYKKYRKNEFDKESKKDKEKVYFENNYSLSLEEVFENARLLYNLLNGKEVVNYLKENDVDNLILNENEFNNDKEEITRFYLDYARYLLDAGNIKDGIEKLEMANDMNINDEEFYLEIAELFERYSYSKEANNTLKKYLLLIGEKYKYFSLNNYPVNIQEKLSKEEIKEFGLENIKIYSKQIPGKYIFKKNDRELIKFIIDADVYLNYFIDDVEGNFEKFLREFGDEELVEYYNEKFPKDYEENSVYTLDEILKRLENIYSNSTSDEKLKFLDKINDKELISNYEKGKIFISYDIPERIEKIYEKFSSKEKIKFLDKIKIDILLDKEIQDYEKPFLYNKKLCEFCLKYAKYLLENGDKEKSLKILSKSTNIYNSSDKNYYFEAAKLYEKLGNLTELIKMLKKYLLLTHNFSKDNIVTNKDIDKVMFPSIVRKYLSKEDIYAFGGNTISVYSFMTLSKNSIKKEDYELLTLIIDFKLLFEDYNYIYNGKKVSLDKFIKELRKSEELKNYY